MSEKFKMIAKTYQGVEDVLADELKALGAEDLEKIRRGVSFYGDEAFMYKANLALRTASRILLPIEEFIAKSDDELYCEAKKINWEDYFDITDTFKIDTVVHSSFFNHSRYAGLKVKDAIADWFMERFQKRPSVNIENPTILIHIHISEDKVTVNLDSSGEPLFKRGYKTLNFDAPLKEDLAAAMVLLSGWKKDSNFYDPFCGSGTILTEAAMIACNIAPNLKREYFGFMGWRGFDEELFQEVVKSLEAKQKEFKYKIIGGDITPRAVQITKTHVKNLGLENIIEVHDCSFKDFKPKEGKGILISNLPYGERLKETDLNILYKQVGDGFKQNYKGKDCWILSSNDEALKYVGLKPDKKIPLYNGKLECKYQKFTIYDGSKKSKYQN